jgi:hypothetical protein
MDEIREQGPRCGPFPGHQRSRQGSCLTAPTEMRLVSMYGRDGLCMRHPVRP